MGEQTMAERRIKVISEHEGLKMIEKAFHGKNIKLDLVELEHDNLKDVNSPYDCSSASRRVKFALVWQKDAEHTETYDLGFYTKKWIEEAEDEYGSVIGSDTYCDVFLYGDEEIIMKIDNDANEFDKKMPWLSYDYDLLLENARLDRDEYNQVMQMIGKTITCAKCEKEFEFKQDSEYYAQASCSDGEPHITILPFCSKDCETKLLHGEEKEVVEE